MKRLTGAGHRTSITAAMQSLPAWLADELSNVHYFCGADPAYAGLHNSESAQDGRSYGDTAHVVYPEHLQHLPLSDRVTSVVLPVVVLPWVVIHELGHVLHERLGFPDAPGPVTGYAMRNEYEAFAEAFTMAHAAHYGMCWQWDASVRRLMEWKARNPLLARYFTGKGGEAM